MPATSNGNGLSCLGPGTKITLGVAVAVLVALGGIGGRYVTGQTTASSHFAAADIHHSSEALNTNWVPRTEYDQRLSDFDKRLERMESKLDKLLDRR